MDTRPSAAKRGYDGQWRKVRAEQLQRVPYCEWPGCTKPGTHVDHVISLARGGTHDAGNLQTLCHAHHNVKTNRVDGGFGNKKVMA